MNKKYSALEILSALTRIVMTILIFYFSVFKTEMYKDVRWAVIVGVYGGWNLTREYYLNK